MMSKAMKFWANEVKKAAKQLVVDLVKDAIFLYIIRTVEEKAKKVSKQIIEICERNGWNAEEYLRFN
ncbi:MAG: hypothetical protein N2749_00865 [Clostridia bacterium]|nr:hypothetical protein [Clostridia bacterium]